MESSPTSSQSPQPSAADAALKAASDARARTADLITSPWWLHVGLGLSVAFAFVSMSLRFASFGVPIGMLLVPMALGWYLKRSTGISVDRSLATPATRRLSTVWGLAFAAVAIAGGAVEWGAGIKGALAVGGALLGVLTVAIGYRIDHVLRRDLRAER
jgi:hypothetical protein